MIDFNPEYEPSGYFSGLIELVRGENGKLLFMILKDGKVSITEKAETEEGIVVPPEVKHLPKSIRLTIPDASTVIDWVKREDWTLYDDLVAYLRRFSYLDNEQMALAAHYVFLTYLHDHEEISYCPYLLFFAVAGRGKSRTGKSLTYVCFRGLHSLDMREAFIVRFSQNLHGTLFLDLTDLTKKIGRNGCEDMLLSRFEKGYESARILYPEKGRFRDTEYFETYGPTIIATNVKADDILETRCLPIDMLNMPGDYENPKPEYALELKARLTAWRVKNLTVTLPKISPLEGISGRLWDITKPLFQVERLVNPSNGMDLETGVLRIAGNKSANNRESLEGRIVEIICNLSEDRGLSELLEWSLKTADITDKFNERRPADKQISSTWMGMKLKSLSLRKRQVNGRSECIITRKDYKKLLMHYGLVDSEKYPQITLSQVAPGPANPLPENITEFQAVTHLVGAGRGFVEDGTIDGYASDERAAIMEHEGGLSGKEAEKRATQRPDVPF